MTTIVIAMVVIVLVAAVFIAYVAFPHRGEDLPVAPWFGRLLRRGARALPTVEPEPTVPTGAAGPVDPTGAVATAVGTTPVEPLEGEGRHRA